MIDEESYGKFDGKLDREYTDNGYYLNENGYKQVYKYISKYIKED